MAATDDDIGVVVGESATSELTLGYYARHAEEFFGATAHVDFSKTQERFARLLPRGASVLDFGCGSGRDAKYFAERGFAVSAIDGSPELCELASSFAGIEVRCERFQDLSDKDAYDGVWACASLLHLTDVELADVLCRLRRALHTGGVLYASFKEGEGERLVGGRYFHDFTEASFCSIMARVAGLAIEQVWTTFDVREGREGERWLNVVLRAV